MVDVFISYSRRDQAKVAMLARAIAAEGYDIWWDEELPPHRSYGDVITDKIALASAAVVVWSADSAQSEWVRAEADMARNQSKLIQTAIDNVMPPLPFNQIQYAEIGDWQGEPEHAGWRKVKLSLAELCGPRTSTKNADRDSNAVPVASQGPATVPPSTMPKWQLLAGLGVVGAALIGVGAIVAGQYGMETVEPPPPAILAGSKEIADKALPIDELGLETPATRFDLLATVTDPDGYSNVRDTPSNGGLIVGRVQVGKAFATYEQTGKWWQVRLPDGTTGYIARSRIRLSGEAEASSKSGREAEAPAANTSGMTFPDSSTRLIPASEFAQLGPSTLRLARNEIYARKGRRFNDPWLRDYFGQFAWYQPRYDEVSLNSIEQQNVAALSAAEARFNR